MSSAVSSTELPTCTNAPSSLPRMKSDSGLRGSVIPPMRKSVGTTTFGPVRETNSSTCATGIVPNSPTGTNIMSAPRSSSITPSEGRSPRHPQKAIDTPSISKA